MAAAWDPATDSWVEVPPAPAYTVEGTASAVWTGSELIVWGFMFVGGEETPVATGLAFTPGQPSST